MGTKHDERARLCGAVAALDDRTVTRGTKRPPRCCAMCAVEVEPGHDLCASCEQAEALYAASKFAG